MNRIAVLVLIPLALSGTTVDARQEPSGRGTETTPQYIVGPTDVLRVNVWKEPELTLDVTVRLDGMITLPLLGDVPAAGRAPHEIAQTVATGIHQFIQNPRVTVSVAQANSARVFVIGRIARPGDLPLTGRMTLLQALALAGGLSEFAKAEGITVIRRDQTVIPVNYKRIADGRDLSQNVLLEAGDTIVVP